MMAMANTKVILGAVVILILLMVILSGMSSKQNVPVITTILENSNADKMTYTIQRLFNERNNISRQLNLKQQKLGQLECERNGKTSNTGGWCKAASTEDGGQHVTDMELVAFLTDFLQGKRIASFGDGPGRYKQLIFQSGKVNSYDAYDGAPYCEETSEGRVQFLDLTLPQYGLPVYDWVMSLEVAEHIPKEFENIYVDNIVRHAREGIILSWARLGQGGYSHVNNQPLQYVKQLMDDNGFFLDETSSQDIQNACSFQWLKANTNVYRRKDIVSFDRHVNNA